MGLRLTKTQKAYQQGVLAKYEIDAIFQPSATIVEQLAKAYKVEYEGNMRLSRDFDEYKAKSIWRIIRERWF